MNEGGSERADERAEHTPPVQIYQIAIMIDRLQIVFGDLVRQEETRDSSALVATAANTRGFDVAKEPGDASEPVNCPSTDTFIRSCGIISENTNPTRKRLMKS